MSKSNLPDKRLKPDPRRKKVERILNNWARKLDAHTVMPNPEVPGVFKQPSYLVVPSLGNLIAIFVAWMPRKGGSWSFVLAAIEDLIEIKAITGSNTIVGLIILNDLDVIQPLTHEMTMLLNQAFDFFNTSHISRVLNEQENFLRDLSKSFYSSRAKRHFLPLWDSERKIMHQNLKHIDKRRAKVLLKTGNYENFPLDAVRKEVGHHLHKEVGVNVQVSQNVRVFNIKQWFMDIGKEYYFKFDFEIRLDPPVLLQVTRGCASRMYLRDLRSLAAKARLVRYRIGPNRELSPRTPDHRLCLAVTSHLRGPRHDEMRYVHGMIAAGWFPVRADLLNIKNLRR